MAAPFAVYVEAVVNDPIAMLKRDHREVEQLLTQLEDSSPGPRRRAAVEKLVEALTLHMDLEEQLLYPIVARQVGREEAEEAEIEHRLAREAVSHLVEMVDAPGFGAVVQMLKAGIKHHVREEEREIFPQLKRENDRSRLEQLGEQMLSMMPPERARAAMRPARKSARKSTGRKATKSTRKSTARKATARKSTGRKSTARKTTRKSTRKATKSRGRRS